MERTTSIDEAKKIMGANFIGYDELLIISEKFPLVIQDHYPDIPFSKDELISKKENYILIIGVSEMRKGLPLTLLSMKDHFGVNPDVSEPCFYNQDWYLKENFMNTTLENKWYLIKKSVFEESRAILPNILRTKYSFPTAILCAYSFFVYWFFANQLLWKNDFVWCSDKDHNGDWIYIGKYIDIDGVNKNGFSIHRHLEIRDFYGAITMLI